MVRTPLPSTASFQQPWIREKSHKPYTSASTDFDNNRTKQRETNVRLVFPPLESFSPSLCARISVYHRSKGRRGCESTGMGKRNHCDVLTKILVNKALPHTGPTKVEKSDNKEERRKGRRKGSEGSRGTRKYEEGTKSKASDFRAETENERKIYETSTLPAFIESECTSESGTRLREWLSNGARATRFYSANNVFVYSTRVLENRRIMVLVYVHQYLDSSRKPNQWVADLLRNSWRTRESSIQELQLASWIRYGGKLRLELRAILRGILRVKDN